MVRQTGVTVFRLNHAPQNVWWPVYPDRLEELTGNVPQRYWCVHVPDSCLPCAVAAHQPWDVRIRLGHFSDVQFVHVRVDGEGRGETGPCVGVVLVDVRNLDEVERVAQLRHCGAGSLASPPARHHVLDLLRQVVRVLQLDVGDHAQCLGVSVCAGEQSPRQVLPLLAHLYSTSTSLSSPKSSLSIKNPHRRTSRPYSVRDSEPTIIGRRVKRINFRRVIRVSVRWPLTHVAIHHTLKCTSSSLAKSAKRKVQVKG